jgi:CelD/BcsL family acetyltransferase involved in cellulose biosynthesis
VTTEGDGGRKLKTLSRPASAWPSVAPLWAELTRSSPHASFFLSPDWVDAWLEAFGAQLAPEIVVFESDGQAVATCLLVSRTERVGPFAVRRLYLNTAGEDSADSACVEYNGFLCRAGWEDKAVEALGAHLMSREWDEVVCAGCNPGAVPHLQRALAGLASVSTWSHDFYVDLAEIRRGGRPYEESLSRNARHQLRRSMRRYEAVGELQVTVAEDPASALSMLNELSALHQETWMGRAQQGCFASKRFTTFHRALIRRAFPSGAVKLLRVTAGEEVVGLLYCFRDGGDVYYYQSGLHYPPSGDNRDKPGLVAHACAVRHFLADGAGAYHFMAGGESGRSYKRSLSNASTPLAWLVVQRPNQKNLAIEVLRRLKRGVTARLPRADRGGG